MAFQILWTKTAARTYHQLEAEALTAFSNRTLKKKKKTSKQEGLFKQVAKTIELLQKNPRYPGLIHLCDKTRHKAVFY